MLIAVAFCTVQVFMDVTTKYAVVCVCLCSRLSCISDVLGVGFMLGQWDLVKKKNITCRDFVERVLSFLH